MNIQGQEINSRHGRKSQQAEELASLTRALSHCCIEKEELICREFGLHAADGRVLASMLREKLRTSTEIAEHLGIGNSRVTPLIDRLAEKGLVTRSEGEQDRRVKQLELTKSGRSVAQRLQDFETTLHQNLLAHFPKAKRRELLNTLTELRAAMDSVRGSAKPEN